LVDVVNTLAIFFILQQIKSIFEFATQRARKPISSSRAQLELAFANILQTPNSTMSNLQVEMTKQQTKDLHISLEAW
jgi:hypothetical protein